MVYKVKAKNEQVSDAFDYGGNNCTMTFGNIQKEFATCCAHEFTKVIMEELGDRKFSVLIDESRSVEERFIALHHVKDTTSQSLNDALYGIFDKYMLSISRIQGQGYDEAFNMRGEFNGLQRKILDENSYAFSVHCYALYLQLVVVSVASSCSSIHDFFQYISLIVTTTSASCIPVSNMNDEIPARGRSRVEGWTITNLHHYCSELCYVAIDKLCMERDHCFSEGSNIILDFFSCLDFKNSFSKFDINKLARLADIYHADLSDDDRGTIRDRLETYVLQVKINVSFSTYEDVQCLATKIVQTEKHWAFALVYKLIELALIFC
ncbi:uncharacterized protein LOC131603471 [Vicia villosa]|uniref:uncharacterized protein LOC131603471 n=1 Tax=Vicia villosa TaxID=3911 RepID=UPI00273B7A9A|nr:uncharacterized protein LOC131603471 [Vicia villosa]